MTSSFWRFHTKGVTADSMIHAHEWLPCVGLELCTCLSWTVATIIYVHSMCVIVTVYGAVKMQDDAGVCTIEALFFFLCELQGNAYLHDTFRVPHCFDNMLWYFSRQHQVRQIYEHTLASCAARGFRSILGLTIVTSCGSV